MMKYMLVCVLIVFSGSVYAGECSGSNCSLRNRTVNVTKDIVSVPVTVTKRTVEATRNIARRTMARTRNIVR
jgi:hypothetical protein